MADKDKLIEKIFSIKNKKLNNRNYKIINLFGLKIKTKNKYKELSEKYNILEKKYSTIEKNLSPISKLYQQKLFSINKEKLNIEIQKFNSLGITKNKRTPQLIVSLTSYPDRMYDIHYTLYSLLTQNTKPDEVILWLAEEQFPNKEEDIPSTVLNLKKNGLTIKWCKDIKSYKKLIPTLQQYPNDIIVTSDDDIYYQKDWLTKLYDTYLKSSKDTIIAHRCHKVNIINNKIQPYNSWKHCISKNIPSYFNFITGAGGILYPPKIFSNEIFNEKSFMTLAPKADDVWFWAMAILNNTKISIVQNPIYKLIVVNPERELNINNETTLYATNKEGENDKQIKNILEHYPIIYSKLITENIKVSIIIPVYNLEKYLVTCLDSICTQTLKEIEIICINDGSTDNSLNILKTYAQQDNRIIIIDKENSGAADSRNRGLNIARGEYITFIDGDDWIDPDYIETLYKSSEQENADIARCTYKYCYPDVVSDAKINSTFEKRKKNHETLKINEHSMIVTNALYNHQFLKENNINQFNSDLRMHHDVPFSVKADFLSEKTIPITGVNYYYRQERPGQLITPSPKRLICSEKANELVIDFINSLNNVDINDYLTAFKRCIWRYDNVFCNYMKLNILDVETQHHHINCFIKNFHKCKYPKELNAEYSEEYFKFLQNNDIEGYINYIKEKINH